jgi:hypothetical protein
LSEIIKEPIYQIIGNFLKSQINISFTISDLIKNLVDSNNEQISRSTISSSLTYLSKGRKVVKNKKIVLTKSGKPKRKFYKGFGKGKIRNVSKGKWIYYGKVDYERWIVNLKVVETRTKNRQREWVESNDLTSKAVGIVPSGTSENKIIDISGQKLFDETMKLMDNEGVFLRNSVDIDDGRTITIGALKDDNQDMMNDRYDPRWEGEAYFTNNYGKTYDPFKIIYDVMEHEYA